MNARGQDAPVRLGGPPALQERNRRDIAPTMPGASIAAPARGNSNANSNGVHALLASNDIRPQRVAGRT